MDNTALPLCETSRVNSLLSLNQIDERGLSVPDNNKLRLIPSPNRGGPVLGQNLGCSLQAQNSNFLTPNYQSNISEYA